MKPMIHTLLVSLMFSSGSSLHAKDSSKLPEYAAFPSAWFDGSENIYPIKNAPKSIQWQAWLAIRSIANSPKGSEIYIESYGGTRESADRIVRYLVDHHHFPEGRLHVREISDVPNWNGWTVVRPTGVSLPPQAPLWDLPSIKTSLASPIRADAEVSYSSIPKVHLRFKPTLALKWAHVDTDRNYATRRLRPTWLGADVSGDVITLEWNRINTGLTGHYYGSMMSLSSDATQATLTEASLGGFGSVQLNPSVIGVMTLRLSGTFYGNWRHSAIRHAFLPPMRGVRVTGEVNTSFDSTLRIGLSTSVASVNGTILQAGGKLSHTLFTTGIYNWDAHIGATVAVARVRDQGLLFQENWSSFQVGIASSL